MLTHQKIPQIFKLNSIWFLHPVSERLRSVKGCCNHDAVSPHRSNAVNVNVQVADMCLSKSISFGDLRLLLAAGTQRWDWHTLAQRVYLTCGRWNNAFSDKSTNHCRQNTFLGIIQRQLNSAYVGFGVRRNGFEYRSATCDHGICAPPSIIAVSTELIPCQTVRGNWKIQSACSCSQIQKSRFY